MTRFERFTFLCNVKERQAIADLAFQLHRSQSDAVRFVVIEAARQLAEHNAGTLSETYANSENKKQDGIHVQAR